MAMLEHARYLLILFVQSSVWAVCMLHERTYNIIHPVYKRREQHSNKSARVLIKSTTTIIYRRYGPVVGTRKSENIVQSDSPWMLTPILSLSIEFIHLFTFVIFEYLMFYTYTSTPYFNDLIQLYKSLQLHSGTNASCF